jgi:hypothetical protein
LLAWNLLEECQFEAGLTPDGTRSAASRGGVDMKEVVCVQCATALVLEAGWACKGPSTRPFFVPASQETLLGNGQKATGFINAGFIGCFRF